MGNGAVERNAARVQGFTGGNLSNFAGVENALAFSYENSDFNGFGKALTGGAFAAAALIPIRGALGGYKTLPSGVVQVDTRDAFRQLSNNPLPNSVYEYDGFRFETDTLGRSISSSGQLTLGNGGNRFSSDRLIGHQGLADDIGFHAGADQFGFPGGALNVSPGNRNLNSSAYKTFENSLADKVRVGNKVTADFQRVFFDNNTTVRPDSYRVIYNINDGLPQTRTFFNRPGG